MIFKSTTGTGKGISMLRLAAFLTALSSTSVLAGFINNKNDWDLLTDGAKTGYVFGVFDLTTGMSNGDKEKDLLKKNYINALLRKV